MSIVWKELPDGFIWVKNGGGQFDVVFDVSIWKVDGNKRYAGAQVTGVQIDQGYHIDDLIQEAIDDCFQEFQIEIERRAEEDAEEQKRKANRLIAQKRISELLSE